MTDDEAWERNYQWRLWVQQAFDREQTEPQRIAAQRKLAKRALAQYVNPPLDPRLVLR